MVANSRVMTAVGMVGLLLTVGCANQDNNRSAQLSAEKDALNARLGQCENALTGRDRDMHDLMARYNAAQQELDALKSRLASLPTPTEAPPGWTPIPGGAMTTIAEDLLFASGKATLRPEAKKTLDKIVETIESRYGDKDILVFGHTDNQPIRKSGWDDNWELSNQRSLAVVRFLGEHGMAHTRLVAAGAGEHWPRVANNSEANRQKNRRVEIFAIDHAQLHPVARP